MQKCFQFSLSLSGGICKTNQTYPFWQLKALCIHSPGINDLGTLKSERSFSYVWVFVAFKIVITTPSRPHWQPPSAFSTMATLKRATLIVTITMAPTFEQGCAEPMPGSLTAISPQFQVGVSAPGSSQPGLIITTSLSVVLPYQLFIVLAHHK